MSSYEPFYQYAETQVKLPEKLGGYPIKVKYQYYWTDDERPWNSRWSEDGQYFPEESCMVIRKIWPKGIFNKSLLSKIEAWANEENDCSNQIFSQMNYDNLSDEELDNLDDNNY